MKIVANNAMTIANIDNQNAVSVRRPFGPVMRYARRPNHIPQINAKRDIQYPTIHKLVVGTLRTVGIGHKNSINGLEANIAYEAILSRLNPKQESDATAHEFVLSITISPSL